MLSPILTNNAIWNTLNRKNSVWITYKLDQAKCQIWAKSPQMPLSRCFYFCRERRTWKILVPIREPCLLIKIPNELLTRPQLYWSVHVLTLKILHVTGNSVCPVLPRPNPCPNEPNQCLKRDECVSGKECCSDGCRMICVQPVVVPTKEPAG